MTYKKTRRYVIVKYQTIYGDVLIYPSPLDTIHSDYSKSNVKWYKIISKPAGHNKTLALYAKIQPKLNLYNEQDELVNDIFVIPSPRRSRRISKQRPKLMIPDIIDYKIIKTTIEHMY